MQSMAFEYQTQKLNLLVYNTPVMYEKYNLPVRDILCSGNQGIPHFINRSWKMPNFSPTKR